MSGSFVVLAPEKKNLGRNVSLQRGIIPKFLKKKKKKRKKRKIHVKILYIRSHGVAFTYVST